MLNTSVLNDNFCSCHASSSFYGHLLFHGHTGHASPSAYLQPLFLSFPPISQHHPSLPLPTPTFLPPAGPLLTWFGLSSYGHLLFHVHVPLRHTSPQLSQDARKPGLAVVAFHGLLGESLQRPLGCGDLSWLTGAYWGMLPTWLVLP